MFITREEAERRLASSKNLANSLSAGKSSQHQEIVKAVAGSLSRQGEDTTETAQAFALSEGQVKSAGHSTNKEVNKRVEASLERVKELALDRLMGALGLLDMESMSGEKPGEISKIAANMSKIVRNCSAPGAEQSNIKLVVYAPRQKLTGDFDVIDV